MPQDANPKVELVKNVISTGFLIFSIISIMGLIFTRQTGLAFDVHPFLAFICLWVAVLWLSVVEGGQASLVGLAPVDRKFYKDTHPIAHKCSLLAHTGDQLDRYLMGRQFMVVFIVFTVNVSGGPVPGAALWGYPEMLIKIFFGAGLAMILLTTMVGQLNSQVNASHCMLDYLNNWVNFGTLCVALGIEFSGLVHASYIIQIMVTAAAGEEVESAEPPRTGMQNLWFFGRCFMSLAILIFAFAITLAALFGGQTTMWEGVPPIVAVIIFFLLMCVVGLLEGMQIAFFAVSRIRADERGNSSWAKRTCELLFRGQGFNLSGFMIGRQLCVVSCMFFIARVTSLNIVPGQGENIWGVSDSAQEFLNLGFLGALITTIVASIAWQLVASAFPIAFLSNPFTYIFLRICLFLEATGICNGAYVIAMIYKSIYAYQRDEVYIGTAEERSAQKAGDDFTQVHLGAGHIWKLPGFQDDAPAKLKKLIRSDKSVREYLDQAVEKYGASMSNIEVDDDGEQRSAGGKEEEKDEEDNKKVPLPMNIYGKIDKDDKDDDNLDDEDTTC